VRVRTYGFPGCFTRPPGTSTRHHPHEPTASKPVVPVDVLPFKCSVAPPENMTPQDAPRPLDLGLNETDAVPSRLRNLLPVHPKASRLLGGAALHLGGLALYGSGAASMSNVRLFPTPVKGVL
jgi:hypothetical protein